LGPGFDVFGLALAEPVDVVEGRTLAEPGIRIAAITGVGAENIPTDPASNTVAIAAAEVMKLLKCEKGLELKIRKGIKPGSGLGSSGAGAAAGAVLASELFGGKLSQTQLIEAAAMAEEKIAGTIHYDNVTAAVVGGFTIVTSIDPLEYVNFDPPPMKIVIAQPSIELPTKLGRRLLPKEIPLSDAIANIGKACTMIAAMREGDLKLFAKNMIDKIAEPVRAPLIPGFHEVKRAAIEAGALGSALAGAGPGVFAILDEADDPIKVADAMRAAFEEAGLKCETIVTAPGPGTKVITRE
jgi:homoserine kinase